MHSGNAVSGPACAGAGRVRFFHGESQAQARGCAALGGVRSQVDVQVVVPRLPRRPVATTGARFALEHFEVMRRDDAEHVEALLVISL